MSALRLVAVVAVALLLAGCADTDTIDPPPDAADDPSMIIEGFQFRGPAEVAAGTTLTVTNRDSASHTWTAQDGTFDTGTLGEGDTTTVLLDTPGTHEFRCDVHPSMGGSITVTA